MIVRCPIHINETFEYSFLYIWTVLSNTITIYEVLLMLIKPTGLHFLHTIHISAKEHKQFTWCPMVILLIVMIVNYGKHQLYFIISFYDKITVK